LKKPEIELAEQFAKGLIAPFRPEKYHDEYQERVKELIESKEKGTAAPKPEKAARLAPVVDLMTALKQSFANKSGQARNRIGDSTRHLRTRKSA